MGSFKSSIGQFMSVLGELRLSQLVRSNQKFAQTEDRWQFNQTLSRSKGHSKVWTQDLVQVWSSGFYWVRLAQRPTNEIAFTNWPTQSFEIITLTWLGVDSLRLIQATS